MITLKVPNGLNFAKHFIISFAFFFMPIYLFDLGFNGFQMGFLMSLFPLVFAFS